MKDRILSILLGFALLSLLPGLSQAQMPPGIRDLEISMLTECDSCDARQPLKVTYTISNNTSAPIHFLKWGTPLEGFKSDMFVVKGPRGNAIKYRGILVTRVGPFPSDYVTIPPHQKISGQIDLAEAYDLHEEGAYVITPRIHRTEIALRKPTFSSPEEHFSPKLIKSKPMPIRQIGTRPQAMTRPAAQSGLPLISPGNLLNPPGGYFHPITSLPPDDTGNGTQITDANQWSAIQRAYIEALRLAAGAKLVLNGTPFEEIQRGANRYNVYFGAADKSRWDYARDVFGIIYGFGFVRDNQHPLKILSGTDDRCGVARVPGESGSSGICRNCCQDSSCPDCFPCPDCNPQCTQNGCCTSVAGYTMGSEIYQSRKNLYLCPLFWNLPLTGAADTQAGIILHEMAHLAKGDTGKESDACYSDRLCKQTAKENPEAAIEAADSYRLFATSTNLTMGLDRIYVSLKAPSRGFLQAQNGGGSFVDFCGALDSSAGVFGLEVRHPTPEGLERLLPWPRERSLSNGDQVSLVTADRKHVIAPNSRPPQPTRPGGVDATHSDFLFFTLKRTGSAIGGISRSVNNGDGIALIGQEVGFVTVSGCGPGSVTCNRVGSPGTAGVFTISLIKDSEQPRHYAHFRAEDGTFLQCIGVTVQRAPWPPIPGPRPAPVNPLTLYPAAAVWAAPCEECTFILINKNGGSLLDGNPVALLTYDGVHYVTEKIQQRGVLSALSTSVNSQQFKIQLSDRRHAMMDRRIQTGDLIELWTLDGRTYPTWKFRIEIAR